MNTLLFTIVTVCSFLLVILNVKRKKFSFIVTSLLAILTSYMVYAAGMPVFILWLELFLVGGSLLVTFLQMYIDSKLS